MLQIVAFYFLMEWVRCHSWCHDQWGNILICFEGRNSRNIRSAAKSRHHRTKSVLPHSQEPNNSSRSTACRFRTAQTTLRDVSWLIKMLDGIYQHLKHLLSQPICHISPVEKEEWARYGGNPILSCSFELLSIAILVSINDTSHLSNLMSFTSPRVS